MSENHTVESLLAELETIERWADYNDLDLPEPGWSPIVPVAREPGPVDPLLEHLCRQMEDNMHHAFIAQKVFPILPQRPEHLNIRHVTKHGAMACEPASKPTKE